MGGRDIALGSRSAALVEYVCIAEHKTDARNAEGYSVTSRSRSWAYCARGAEQNHEWVRVPPTPLDEITIGRMEDRPPDPRRAAGPYPQLG